MVLRACARLSVELSFVHISHIYIICTSRYLNIYLSKILFFFAQKQYVNFFPNCVSQRGYCTHFVTAYNSVVQILLKIVPISVILIILTHGSQVWFIPTDIFYELFKSKFILVIFFKLFIHKFSSISHWFAILKKKIDCIIFIVCRAEMKSYIWWQ